jgi:hypothetical protein
MYGHLHYFKAIWNILWPLGNVVVIWNIFPVLVYFVKKNPATLIQTSVLRSVTFYLFLHLSILLIKMFRIAHVQSYDRLVSTNSKTSLSRQFMTFNFFQLYVPIDLVDKSVCQKKRPRVARWFVFKPKIQIWVNFFRALQWKMYYILWSLGPFYGFCYILWTFGIIRSNMLYIFPFWYFVPRKIWQPCKAVVKQSA